MKDPIKRVEWIVLIQGGTEGVDIETRGLTSETVPKILGHLTIASTKLSNLYLEVNSVEVSVEKEEAR